MRDWQENELISSQRSSRILHDCRMSCEVCCAADGSMETWEVIRLRGWCDVHPSCQAQTSCYPDFIQTLYFTFKSVPLQKKS